MASGESFTILAVLRADDQAGPTIDELNRLLDQLGRTALRTGDDTQTAGRLMADSFNNASRSTDELTVTNRALIDELHATARVIDENTVALAGLDERLQATRDDEGELAVATRAANDAGGDGVNWMGLAIKAALLFSPALVAAGAAIGSFAALAAPAFLGVKNGLTTISQAQNAVNKATTATAKNAALKKLQADWAAIPPAQAKVIREVQNFESEYKKLGSAVQPQVLGVFSNGLSFLSTLLPKLTGLAQTGGNALDQLTGALSKIAASKGATEFFQTLNTTAQQVLPLLGELVGTLGGILVNAIETLAPAMKPLLTALDDLVKALGGPLKLLLPVVASAFIQIANAIVPLIPMLDQLITQGIAALLPVVIQLIPMILTLAQSGLKSLLTAAIALMPVLVVIAKALTDVLQVLQPLMPFLGQLISYWIMASAAAKIFAGVMSLVDLAMDANPISLIVIAIAALVLAFVTLWEKSSAFRDFWKDVWKDIQDIVKAVVDFLAPQWKEMASEVEDAWKIIKSVSETLWKWMETFIADSVSGIRTDINWFEKLPGLFESWWHDTTSVVSSGVNNTVNWFKKLPSEVKSLLSDSGSWLVHIGENIIHGLINGIENSVGGLLSYVSSIGSSITKTIGSALKIFSPSRVMADEIGKYIPLGIAAGISENMDSVAKAAQMAGNMALTGAKVGLNVSGGMSGLGSNLAYVPAAGAGSGSVTNLYVTGNTVMGDADLNNLVNKIGTKLATSMLPQGGVRIRA